MAKYIDAEKLVLEIKKKSGGLLSGWDTAGVLAVVLNQPTADVKKVVRGKWEYAKTESNMAVVKCSVCGQEQFAISGVVANGNFCPSCGADMEVE